MRASYKLALTLLAGVALGAAAIQGLHAQAKPKVYLVTESEVLDAANIASYTADLAAGQKAAGGRALGTRGKIVAVVGEPPKRVGISEWVGLEQVQAWHRSAVYKNLVEGKKAVKIHRQYIVEAGN